MFEKYLVHARLSCGSIIDKFGTTSVRSDTFDVATSGASGRRASVALEVSIVSFLQAPDTVLTPF